MTHLKIEQNSNVEIVPDAVVHKLYLLAKAGLDSASSLTGNLLVQHAKRSEIEFLTSTYQGLTINAADGYYMEFEDPYVEEIVAREWGDGVGITATQALTVKTDHINTTMFNQNTNITSFDELANFPTITSLYGQYNIGSKGAFYGCSNLKSIDLRHIKYADNASFAYCTSLETVKNFNNVLSIGSEGKSSMFYGCTSLKNIDLSNETTIVSGLFEGCTSLKIDVHCPNLRSIGYSAFQKSGVVSVSNLGNIKTLGGWWNGGAFGDCTNLETVVLPETLENTNYAPFIRCTSLKWIKCLATTPPTAEGNPLGGLTNVDFKLYVPDESVEAYKADAEWGKSSDRIFALSTFSE